MQSSAACLSSLAAFGLLQGPRKAGESSLAPRLGSAAPHKLNSMFPIFMAGLGLSPCVLSARTQGTCLTEPPKPSRKGGADDPQDLRHRVSQGWTQKRTPGLAILSLFFQVDDLTLHLWPLEGSQSQSRVCKQDASSMVSSHDEGHTPLYSTPELLSRPGDHRRKVQLNRGSQGQS